MRIWVTRSEPAGDRLVSALEKSGLDAKRISALTIKPLSTPRIRSLKGQSASSDSGLDIDLVILVSQHAARLYRQSGYFDATRQHLAIGPATARALGIEADIAARSDTTGILAHLSLSDHVGSILLIAGEGGRPDLVDALRQRSGASYKLELYQRVPADLSAFWPEEGDMMEVSSLFALEVVSAELDGRGPQVSSLSLIVPSQRIADEAGALGFERVYVAPGATAEDIVAGVFEWQEQKHRHG